MQAILLVGGLGTRLHPLTRTIPKQMLPILHRPMIEHVVAGLARHGVDTVVLSLGYRDDAFTTAYPDGDCAGVELRCAVEPEPLDTAGAIRFAYRSAGLDEARGAFLVANGDVITDADVSALVRRHDSVGAEATIHLTGVDDPSRYGVVITDDDGRVSEFLEKPQPGAASGSRWVNAGTYVMEPSVIERIPDGRRVSVEREIFPAMAEDRTLWAVSDEAYWVDAGTPETYLQAQLDLLDGRRGPSECGVSPRAVVAPGALVERSVVMDSAVVEPGASVRSSTVHSGAVIGAGAVVEDSVVGAGARVGPGARVSGGTLIGEGYGVAGGSTLSGARVPAAD